MDNITIDFVKDEKNVIWMIGLRDFKLAQEKRNSLRISQSQEFIDQSELIVNKSHGQEKVGDMSRE